MTARRWAFLAALLFAAADARAAETSVTVFAGQQTANVWEEVLTLRDIRFIDARLAGVAGAVEWPVGAGWALGIEAQLVRHWGSGSYWEASLPATIRYSPRSPPGPFRSAAFGLGLSRTSDVPEIEIRREGQSREVLFYWMLEAEFATPVEDMTALLRLHHRSSGFGYFGDSGSSNAVVFGLRHRF